MEFRKRFELMVEKLETNRNVKITRIAFGNPASDAEIEQATKLAEGVLPDGVGDFFREVNGFHLEWEHTIKSIKQHNDTDNGVINILPLPQVFSDGKNITWFDDFEGGDKYKAVKPLDCFVPEACAAFYQPTGQPPQNTVYYHYFGEYLEDTSYTFLEYIERILASRGYFYWIQTLCKNLQAQHEVANFRKNMPLIFDDYNDALFHPK